MIMSLLSITSFQFLTKLIFETIELHINLKFSIALGSCAVTSAFFFTKSVIIFIAGDSLTSSVSGLKAKPNNKIFFLKVF